jgi:hypothetical protein
MSFSVSTLGIPRICDFAQALACWGAALSWRNNAEERALDGRRMHHKRIRRRLDGGYECILYSTAMVTYLPDGSVFLNAHPSKTSRRFAHRVAPQGCIPLWHQGCMLWSVRTAAGNRFYRVGRDLLHLRPAGPGQWTSLSAPVAMVEQIYDPKIGAKTRKMLQPYELWYQAVERLGTVPMPQWPGNQGRKMVVDELLSDFENPELFAKVASFVGDPQSVRQLSYLATGAHYGRPVPPSRLPRKAFA